jgi:hypothetical protein
MLSLREGATIYEPSLNDIFFKIHQFTCNLPLLAIRNTIKGFEAVIQ